MVKRFLMVVGVILLPIFSITAEVNISSKMSAIVISNYEKDRDVTLSEMAMGSLTIKSQSSKYVKSQITLDLTSTRDISTMEIKKAWIKFRFPFLRGTVGKNRVTWGEGVVFNAGDIIFDDYFSAGSEAEAVDLTADELKSKNRTLALLSFPLGRFTFIETILLPYDFFPSVISLDSEGNEVQSTSYSELEVNKNSFGGRFVSKVNGVKIETGYLFNGFYERHKTYLSFNGTLLLDYHLSGSINIIHGYSDFYTWKHNLKLSAGLFYLFELENDKTLTFRVESMIKPFADYDNVGVKLYPEIVFIPNEELSLIVRSIFLPLDLAHKSSIGINWKTYQGFNIGSFLTLDISENSNSYSLLLNISHKF